MNRRQFLKGAAGLAAVGLLGAAGCAQPAAPAAAPTTAPAPKATEAPKPAATTAPAAVATAAPAATQAPAAAQPVALTVWWWGEQEAPGLEKWMKQTVDMYKTVKPNVSISTVLQSGDTLYPAFRAAAQAKKGPDIQYLWSGVWTMEDVWAGSVAPISDLLPQDVQHILPGLRDETAFDGKIWGLGWYMAPVLMAYNKDLFKKAGLDANAPPATWADLLTASDKLNAASVTPWGYGFKGETGKGLFVGMFLPQEMDASWELLKPTVGEESYSSPKYTGWFARLAELIKRGGFNKDCMSLDYQQGQNLFPAGKAAMTVGVSSNIANWAKDMGEDKVGVMPAPAFGKGKLAGTIGNLAQQLTVTSFSPNKQSAADFLAYMHTPERLKAMYEQSSALPADDRFDLSAVKSAADKAVLQLAKDKGSIWYQDYLPAKIDREAFGASIDRLFLGDFTPDQAVKFVDDYVKKWQNDNASTVAQLKKWRGSFK